MVRHWRVVQLFLLFAFPSAASAAPVSALEPIGPWVLDYAEAQCSAAGKYGQPDNPLTFAIRPAPNGETYELLVGRRRSGPVYASELKGSVDFGGGATKAWLLHYGGGGKKVDVYAYRITSAEMSQARSASAVTLQTDDGPDFSFKLYNMAELISGLQRCTEDLKGYWNINRSKVETVGVKGDLRRIFTSDDYPGQAAMAGKEGAVQFLLLIDEKGSVAGCHVEKPSGVPILDAMGCQVMRERGKFKPARDANGKVMRSSVYTPPVVWRMGS